MINNHDTNHSNESVSQAPFNPRAFFIQPKSLCREFCWLFGLVELICTLSGSYDKDNQTIFGQDDNAFRYGVFLGITSFLFSAVQLVSDVASMYEKRQKMKRRIVIVDLGISGLLSFLFFVGFCYLMAAWTSRKPLHPESIDNGVDNARAAIVFCGFSIIPWAGSTYFAYKTFKDSSDTHLENFADAPGTSTAPYSSLPGTTGLSEYQKTNNANEDHQYTPPWQFLKF